MARVPAWYSVLHDVYHVCTGGVIGALVKGEYRRSGEDTGASVASVPD